MFYKFFTNATFEREKFCDLLKYKCNVRCKPVADGFIFDREAFATIHPAHLPHWVYINRQDMLSNLHTRPATTAEEMDLKFCWRYELREMTTHRTTTLHTSNDRVDLAKYGALYRANLYRDRPNLRMMVIDVWTGEVVWEG